MKTPDKVTLIITPAAYTLTTFAGRKVLSKRTMKMESNWNAKATKNGEIRDDFPDHLEELAQTLENLDGFSVACELRKLREKA